MSSHERMSEARLSVLDITCKHCEAIALVEEVLK